MLTVKGVKLTKKQKEKLQPLFEAVSRQFDASQKRGRDERGMICAQIFFGDQEYRGIEAYYLRPKQALIINHAAHLAGDNGK